MQPRKIAVVGAGLMGHGIAQCFASAGHAVAVFEPDAGRRDEVVPHIRANLRRVGADESAAERVSLFADLAATVADAHVVIEAAPEDLPLKQRVFAQIEAAAPEDALLASNTSVIPITSIMQGLRHRARAMGTHWWNPPHQIPLVEVVQGADTGEVEIAAMIDLLRSVGKMPVHVRKDVPGFIGNRLQHALWREAIALVEAGVCDARTVDEVVKASFGRRLAVLGPLENADLVGTDLTLAIHTYLLPHIDHRPEPSPLLRQLVSEGRLGMKSGGGFRDWTAAQADAVRSTLAHYLDAFPALTPTDPAARRLPIPDLRNSVS